MNPYGLGPIMDIPRKYLDDLKYGGTLSYSALVAMARADRFAEACERRVSKPIQLSLFEWEER